MNIPSEKWDWIKIVLNTADNKTFYVPTHLFENWKGRLRNFRSELIDPCQNAYRIVENSKEKAIVVPYTISFHSWNIAYFEPFEKQVEIRK